ncbi:MAG: hypothetical protein INQ03_11790 [Candidatus Heimdallarchaeota archaeon]|nr:hypothetical protein [Candidatus Heimdallarchaeota archaeon]
MMTRAKTYAQLKAEGKTDDEIFSETVGGIEKQEKRSFRKNILYWHIGYLILSALMFPFTNRLAEGTAITAIALALFMLSSLALASQAKGGTQLVVPAVAVADTSITDDITRARGRMFEKMLGPLIGYFYAIILFLIDLVIKFTHQ